MIEPHDGAGHELQFQMTRSPIETPGDKSRYTKALVVRETHQASGHQQPTEAER